MFKKLAFLLAIVLIPTLGISQKRPEPEVKIKKMERKKRGEKKTDSLMTRMASSVALRKIDILLTEGLKTGEKIKTDLANQQRTIQKMGTLLIAKKTLTAPCLKRGNDYPTLVCHVESNVPAQDFAYLRGTVDADDFRLETSSPGGAEFECKGSKEGTFFLSTLCPGQTKFVIDGIDGEDRIQVGGDFGSIALTILGGPGNDVLIGGLRGEKFEGGDDEDRILAGGGNDFASGGEGEDCIDTGFADEAQVIGDIANGDAGNDQMVGEFSWLFGGGGADTIVKQTLEPGGYLRDYVFFASGEEDNDTIEGSIGGEFFAGGEGQDYINTGEDFYFGDPIYYDCYPGSNANQELCALRPRTDFVNGGTEVDEIKADRFNMFNVGTDDVADSPAEVYDQNVVDCTYGAEGIWLEYCYPHVVNCSP